MPTRIDRDEVQRLLRDERAQLIEVLPREAYDEAHLPDAMSLPLTELTRARADRLDRERPVVAYCYDFACDLSPRAAWRLEALGFRNVYHYIGGKADWMAAGLPIEGTAASLTLIGRLARPDVPTCPLSARVAEIRPLLGEWSTCFVVNDERIVLGRVYRSRLGDDDEARVEDVMDPGPVTFRPDITVDEMADRMRRDELRTAPVRTSDGRLIGLVFRADVERAASDRRERVDARSPVRS